MEKHSFMERLLEGVEVEWKKLGDKDLFNVFSGGTPSKSKNEYWENGTIPWLKSESCNNIPVYQAHNFITELGLQKSSTKLSKQGTTLIALVGATIFKTAYLEFDSTTNQNIASIKSNNASMVNDKFIFYYITNLYEKLKSEMSNYGMLNLTTLRQFPIPIPPLEVQSEIVRILDNFTELTAELTAELSARKKQYTYYRDKLLSFEEGEVEWKKLGEIGEVRMCKRILKKQTSETSDIPFYKIGTFGKNPNTYISREIFNEYKNKYNYPKVGEILISASGTIGRTVIFDGEEAYFQDSNIVWIENDERIVLNKYLFYCYQIVSWHISDGGVIKRLYNDNIRKTTIPIPYPNDINNSLEKQKEIVAILDKFDTLTNSISEGLPKEIALRQKQYEYYRDLLLSFPKQEVEA